MDRTREEAAGTLERLRAEASREWQRARRATARRAPRTSRARRVAVLGLRLAALVALPFVVLVRVAVTAYAEGHATWLALGAATAVAVGVVTLYAAWVSKRLSGRARLAAMAKTVALPLVVGYTLYALLYVSGANVKSSAVRSEYLRLHPILRLAVSTLILADDDLVITDVARLTADYPQMGLRALDGSRHLRQRDGYAHALDVRTAGRGAIPSWLIRLYFELMGFDTLRHVGTADHLHVELRWAGTR